MANPIPGWLGIQFDKQGREDLTHAGSPPSWNRLIINGITMPGQVFIESVKHALVKFAGRASGKSPGASTIRGREPGIARATLTLRNNEEWDEYVSLMPRLLPYVKKGASPTAGSVSVQHPFLAAHYIKHVLIESVDARGPRGGGPAIVTMVLEESEVQTDIKVGQAKPKPRNPKLDYAATIDIAGQAPKPPNLKDYGRTPAQAVR